MISKTSRCPGRPRSSTRLRMDDCHVLAPFRGLARAVAAAAGPSWDPATPTAVSFAATWPDGYGGTVSVSVVGTRQHLGGFRAWYVCGACDRRVGRLYQPSPSRAFSCRHCWGVLYDSQFQDPDSRMLLRLLTGYRAAVTGTRRGGARLGHALRAAGRWAKRDESRERRIAGSSPDGA
jgi:hypothetical protein